MLATCPRTPSCCASAAAVRADTLVVSGTLPYYGTNVLLSFDWNTATDHIYDVKMSDGFALLRIPGAVGFDPQSNSITYMDFTSPNGKGTPLTADFIQFDGN
jgi:hypothetical protein